MLLVGIIAFGLSGTVLGHGNIVWPPAWQDANGTFGLKSGKQCSGGAEVEGYGWVGTCDWVTRRTFIKGPPTLPDDMLTWLDKSGRLSEEEWAEMLIKNGPALEQIKSNSSSVRLDPTQWPSWTQMPWRAPGSAKVNSPCGVALGFTEGIHEGPNGVGTVWFPAAQNFKFEDVVTTQWKIGSRVEAHFGILGNHGGGYSYRLCKVPKEGVTGLTEECFQKTPLRFSGNQQWVQYGEDKSTRVYFAANRTDIGTIPKGSQWTKIPIPACAGWRGGKRDKDDLCASGFQFDPPAPGLFGYGKHPLKVSTASIPHAGGEGTGQPFPFSVGDNLDVPDGLEPGEYVLGFRWDCEQLPQVYNSCSTITLIK